MSLPVPIPTLEVGPAWAQDLYTCLYNVVDQHNHSPGSGVQINQSGILLTGPLSFQTQSATNLLSTGFTSQSSPLSLATYPSSIYVSGGNLYFNSSSTQIQLTTPTSVNATSSGISSGTASASFVSSVLVVNEAANTPANIQAGSLLIGNNTAGSNFVTLAPPSALAASYTLTLPAALPGSTSLLSLTSAGSVVAGSTNPALPGKASTAGGQNIAVSAYNDAQDLSILRGQMNANGSAVAANGFSGLLNGTGNYTVNFSTAFADVPSVSCQVTQASAVNNAFCVTLYNIGTTSFSYKIWNVASSPAALSSQNASFIVIGQLA